MAIYYPGDNCQSSVPEHLCDPCLTKELGGVRGVAFVPSDFTFTNPSSDAQWVAAVAAGAIIIPETNGTFDGGTAQEGLGFGDNPTSLDGYDFVLQFFDPNYKGNCDHYDNLKNARGQFKVAFITETQLHLSSRTVTVLPKNPIAADVKSKVLWDVTVKFTQQNLVCSFDKPSTIFRCTQIL